MVGDPWGRRESVRLDATGACPPSEVLLAVPTAASGADRRRAVAAVRAAADCPVRTVEAPSAAALGAGIVEMAVITDGRLSHARSVQVT